MAKKLCVQCDGCFEKCNPSPIPIETIGALVKSNPRIADGIANLEIVVLVCPYTNETLFASL